NADAALVATPASKRRNAAPPSTCLSILVVDDEDVVRGWMRETLVSRGHRVVEAASGGEGIVRCDEGAFDVVIADWRMPGMDGEQFLEEVNAYANSPTRRVLITGRFETEEEKELPSGLDAVLRKPCSAADLVEAAEGGEDASIPSGDRGRQL
ncbi:MAG: response regulator, partial [Planctomycetes bacterium]|nr:response regulator [Planctomycetota bacterium]